MKKNIITILSSVLFSSLVCLGILYFKAPKQQAYLENAKLFDHFKGKKELETKLLNIKSKNKLYLDSVRTLVSNQETELYYRQQLLVKEEEEEQLTIQYNTQIWNQLNSYIKEYGNSNNYDFIYGVVGNGTMMYARSDLDVTNEIIEYANKTYEGN